MASNSCQFCHHRKVRCDVNASGPPCTNCRLDGRQCEKRAPLKRGRKSRVERDGRRSAASTIVPAAIRRSTAIPDPALVNQYSLGASSTLPATSTHNRILGPSSVIDGGQSVHSSGRRDGHAHGSPVMQSPSDAPLDTHILVPFYYHNFLRRPDIRHLRPTQVQKLEDLSSLKVPSGHVLNEFIRHYFLYVHPCLPILNESSFWSVFNGETSDLSDSHGISLALFQAMLFAASRFVQSKTIESCGFENLEHARASFHRRAELLLQNEVERDALTLAQVSLLLSLQSTIEDQSLNSTWLTRAIQYAKQAGAHKYYDSAIPHAGTLLDKKKLWWCCILRDRMIAIGVRRGIQITPDVFDFDQGCLEEADFGEDQEKSQVYQPATKAMLTRIIVAQCELALAQTPTLMAAYNATPGQDASAEASTIPQLMAAMTEIGDAKTELAVWARRFRNPLLACVDGRGQTKDTSGSVTLFADMTLIHYYSTLVALSNYSVSVLEKHQVHLEDYDSRLDDLNTHLKTSITDIANRVKRLSDQGLAHHLPISAPACTALPFVLEALNFRLSTSSQKSVHQKQLDYYSKIMKMFRAQNDHAECVTTAVDSILPVVELEVSHMMKTGSPRSAASIHNGAVALSRPSSWSDMLANNPLVYLRLSSFLDLTLSKGRTPHVTDLPVWTLGTAAASALQAQAASSSLQFMSPLIPQNALPSDDRSRFVEIDDNEEAVMTGEWPDFDQTSSMEISPASMSFADIDMVRAWFEFV